jgi:plasmid stabilization system protein ParE
VKLIIRQSAYRDLERIFHWIARDSPANARSVADRIVMAIEITLAEFPFIGRRGRKPGTREWVVRGLPYVIVYQVDEVRKAIIVRAIYHGAQRR